MIIRSSSDTVIIVIIIISINYDSSLDNHCNLLDIPSSQDVDPLLGYLLSALISHACCLTPNRYQYQYNRQYYLNMDHYTTTMIHILVNYRFQIILDDLILHILRSRSLKYGPLTIIFHLNQIEGFISNDHYCMTT